MLHLYHHPGNASLAPHLLLEELGARFELHLIDRDAAAHKTAAYLRLNPNGLIPVLIDARSGRELVLYEAAAICLHLADTHQAALAPPLGSDARAQLYKWMTWLTNSLQAALMVYFYPERWADSADAVQQVKVHAEAKAGALLDTLDAEFARHGGPWLLGETFSAADPFAFMLGRWSRGFARPARSLPHLGPYLQRMLARPATARVMEREGLPKPWV